MKKKTNVKIMLLVIGLVILCTSMNVKAVTLKGSFSGGSTYKYIGEKSASYSIYQKSTYAQTKGYKGKHYVRAYIGGTRNSTKGAVADTGKQYSYRDIKSTAIMKGCVPRNPITGTLQATVWSCFPTGYAKYGTN